MNCRSCGGKTHRILDLGDQPLANNLLADPADPFDTYPLNVEYCQECHLGQLGEMVPPGKMFNEYLFYSRASAPVVSEAKKLVDETCRTLLVYDNLFVMEIASNDGYLLQHYLKKGIPVLGIDPARGPANEAALHGVPTIQDYFDLDLAKTLPKANVIHAQNVLAHVPYLNDFVAGIAACLKPNGVAIIEVPYFGDLLRDGRFDTVYHEHSYYFTLQSLTMLFNRNGLGIRHWKHIDTLGGSLRLWVSRGPNWAGTCEPSPLDLQKKADAVRTGLREQLARLGPIWGYGAPAKATVMLNFCELNAKQILRIADTTPAKQGMYIPGTGIEVCAALDAPDYVCIFAWNYAEFIRRERLPGVKTFTPYDLDIRC